MTDQKQESGRVEEEAKVQSPVPPAFSKSDDKRTSDGNGVKIDELVDKIWEKLAPRVEDVSQRQAKSLQDRRFSKLEKEMGRFEDVADVIDWFKQLKEQGLSDEEAKYRIKTESTITELKDTLQSLTGSKQKTSLGSGVDVASEQSKLLAEAGLSVDDPGVAEFISTWNGDDPQKYLLDLNRYIIRRLARKPAANPANVQPQSAAQSPVGSSDQEELMRAYKADLAKIRRGDTLAITKLKQEYRRKGLNIW